MREGNILLFLENLFLAIRSFLIPTMVRCEPSISGLDHIYKILFELSSDSRDKDEEAFQDPRFLLPNVTNVNILRKH